LIRRGFPPASRSLSGLFKNVLFLFTVFTNFIFSAAAAASTQHQFAAMPVILLLEQIIT
jgi:hypothetical protein